jgi:putative heme-binding domain-containing protein
MKYKTPLLPLAPPILVILIFLLSMCSEKPEVKYGNYEDTTVPVYGPYRVIKLPVTKGIKILNPIQLAQGPDGKLFAANQSGEVYTLQDSDEDGLEDEAVLFCNVTEQGLRSPGGFAHRNDTVFIGTSEEIRAYIDRNNDGRADTSWTFFNEIPHSEHPYEWTCGMNFGPDGWLYFVLSTDSWNAGASPDPKGFRGSLLRISPDGKRVERLATGIRSVYGTAFNQHGDLFFTDNEGGGNLKEELNYYIKGGFYGHNPKKYPGYDSIMNPAHALEAEVAPSAIAFNKTDNDFGGTGGNLFVAFYGPGERWKRGALGRIKIERRNDGSYSYEEFPVADIPKLSGLAFGKDGSLYLAHHGVSDYWYNSITEKTGGYYKVVYDPSLKGKPIKSRAINATDLSAGSIESGKQLFAEQACLACHAVDGKSELLGPNLNGIGSRLSREEILEEIKTPSKIIKPSMGGMRITKKDGQVLLGRVVSAEEKEISLMLVGNSIVKIPRNEIRKIENETKSLMYEGLLQSLDQEQVNNLLDYISSLK